MGRSHWKPKPWSASFNDCGKKQYLTRREAEAEHKRHPGRPEKLRAYHCRRCGFWHMGHLPRAVIEGRLTAEEYYYRTGES